MQSSQYYTYAELTIDRNVKVAIKRDGLLLSFILETYIYSASSRDYSEALPA